MPHFITWSVAAVATAGVILRPFGLPEEVWAVSGAVVLLLLGAITPAGALAGIAKGSDVYLFLTGMMLLAEISRMHGLFDWLAAHAARRAKGSARRLFVLIYGVGTMVTVFLSNDATAVVLTPAVAAAVRAAKADDPLPYLLICAFIANAASFVLPISNPANLVIYHSQMPALALWLARFGLPSVLTIGATFVVLRWTQRRSLARQIAVQVDVPILGRGGKTAALGILATAIVLLAASALGIKLGLPTAIAGTVTLAIVLITERAAPWPVITGISWGVLPLVAGLFVLVEALQRSGLIGMISGVLQAVSQRDPAAAACGMGIIVAFAGNLMNNLPVGLIAGTALQSAHAATQVTNAVLIGVDVGPNLSVTGSLATILWLAVLRREGVSVSAWTFLKLGALVMPPALIMALAAVFFRS